MGYRIITGLRKGAGEDDYTTKNRYQVGNSPDLIIPIFQSTMVRFARLPKNTPKDLDNRDLHFVRLSSWRSCRSPARHKTSKQQCCRLVIAHMKVCMKDLPFLISILTSVDDNNQMPCRRAPEVLGAFCEDISDAGNRGNGARPWA